MPMPMPVPVPMPMPIPIPMPMPMPMPIPMPLPLLMPMPMPMQLQKRTQLLEVAFSKNQLSIGFFWCVYGILACVKVDALLRVQDTATGGDAVSTIVRLAMHGFVDYSSTTACGLVLELVCHFCTYQVAGTGMHFD